MRFEEWTRRRTIKTRVRRNVICTAVLASYTMSSEGVISLTLLDQDTARPTLQGRVGSGEVAYLQMQPDAARQLVEELLARLIDVTHRNAPLVIGGDTVPARVQHRDQARAAIESALA